ncbi:uncharacterized protein LOC126297529 isoform X2 [Schistocerca gregaria]|uniref:uncharacterized protein LOC126297529 isoform X2 n=1 Tax=Schistocerca gregaria TaxID=7010 RepID=UPI00211DFA9A|nr:uncharacterized protein LOC126297529 isoform X2 [Schistocerca gregaria]
MARPRLPAALLAAALLSGCLVVAEEEEQIVPPANYAKRGAENLGLRFNMGKKFGRYSWLRSADSTRRRVEFYLASQQRLAQQKLPEERDEWRPFYN